MCATASLLRRHDSQNATRSIIPPPPPLPPFRSSNRPCPTAAKPRRLEPRELESLDRDPRQSGEVERVHLPGGGVRILATTAGMLALTLLTPFLYGFELALRTGNSPCEMKCCRTAKADCHRPDHDGHHRVPSWTSTPECPSGCGQGVSLTGPVCPGRTAGAFLGGPSLRASSSHAASNRRTSAPSSSSHSSKDLLLFSARHPG